MGQPNFNYQVALKSGLKSLQDGRLRQAEQDFKFLVAKFPGAEGGYRGLAKVYFEQEDRPGALRILREGASALTKSGERSSAIGLLREAVALDPIDLATHRRLAAALALAGDGDAAVMEYQRYVRATLDSGDRERARLEAAYAMEQLRDVPGARDLGRWVDGGAPPPPPAAPRRMPQSPEEMVRTAWSAPAPPPANQPWPQPPPPRAKPAAASEDAWGAHESAAAPAPANDLWATAAPPAAPTRAAPRSAPTRAASLAAETVRVSATAADATPADGTLASADSAVVEADAARYLGTHDPRAADSALEAARRYIKDGRNDAASDLLLQLIASGVADHDAQRLLVDVVRLLPGKRDVVKQKCKLLVQALLLDGRNDLAAEVAALVEE